MSLADVFDSDSDDPLPRWLEGDSLAPPCQTEYDIIEDLLIFCKVTHNDYVYDLGCGDGRLCIAAAKNFGARACGIEIEEELADKFKASILRMNLSEKVKAVHGDLRSQNLSDATIIFLYLLPESIEEIKPILVGELQRGCTIVCNTWGLKGLIPVKVDSVGPYSQNSIFMYNKNSLNV